MPRLPNSRSTAFLAAAAAAAALAGCGADRTVTGSTYPFDYRERHPIMLADGTRSLDVFVNGSGLDRRQYEDVRAFALEYLRHGHGPITAQMPTGGGTDFMAHRTLEGVRAALAEGGLSPGALSVSSYVVAHPKAASAVRLSFHRLQAKVATKCGLWPKDVGVSNFPAGFNNEPYWNLGCAVQSNVASQVADPVDLVRGRQEGRIDTLRRSKDIENIRQGKDPSTQYRQDGQNSVKQQANQ
jgi:pilus assembly protein CpaD